MARASGFHTRPVTLRDDWWRRGGGEPLLGWLDDDDGTCRPVALAADGGPPAVDRAELSGRPARWPSAAC